MVQVTYQKRDGCVIQRLRKTMPPYKIGETTSMNWKVLNIEYEHNNKYYSKYEYDTLFQNKRRASIKKQQTMEFYIREIKTFIYYSIALLIIKMLLGV